MSGYFGDKKIVEGYFRASNGQLYRVLEGYFGDKLIYRRQTPGPGPSPESITKFDTDGSSHEFDTTITWNAGQGMDGPSPTYYVLANKYTNLNNTLGPTAESMWGAVSSETDETIRVKIGDTYEDWTIIEFYIQAWCTGSNLNTITLSVYDAASFGLTTDGKFIIGTSIAELKTKYGH